MGRRGGRDRPAPNKREKWLLAMGGIKTDLFPRENKITVIIKRNTKSDEHKKISKNKYVTLGYRHTGSLQQ